MIIKIYKKLSPHLKSVAQSLGFSTGKCRYTPTCSEYASISLKRHGLIKGTFLSVKRVLKCHPWSPGGIDPVPK